MNNIIENLKYLEKQGEDNIWRTAKAAREEIERLQEESNRLHTSAAYWSAEARRYQRLYDCASACGN